MNFTWKNELTTKMLICNLTLKNLLTQIKSIENNDQLSLNDKLVEIRKIQEEIKKVGMEIDIIKKEITMVNAHKVN